MKIKALIIHLMLLPFTGFAQDSTFLPESGIRNGKFTITSYPDKSYIPVHLQNILDSINGTAVHIADIGEKEVGNNNTSRKPTREFRRLDKYPYAWLLTYRHRGDSNHIHFIVFSISNGSVYRVTAGISESDIDSISTLQRRKQEKSITFINLESKTQLHKF